jgi:hypothetical protein
MTKNSHGKGKLPLVKTIHNQELRSEEYRQILARGPN